MGIIGEFFQKKITVYMVLTVLVGLFIAAGCAKKSMPLSSSHIKATGAELGNNKVAKSQAGKAVDSQVTEETLTENETASPFSSSGKATPDSGSQSGLDDFAPAKDGGLQIARMLPFQTTSELDDVHFQFDRHDMDGASQLILQKNASWLKQHPGVKLEIQGHADERGTNNYNLGLGERRAQSVKKYLTALGIAKDRLFAVSYGEEKPFCSENDENCWWQNRRGHFLVSVAQAGEAEVLGMLR